jgi:hypothetical protein
MEPLASPAHSEPVEIDDRRKNSNRREAPRRKILRGGRTFWPNGDSTKCVVHNLSDTGALLQIHGPAPKNFDLVIDGDTLVRSCCVVWRQSNRMGVKFQGEFRSVGASTQSIRGPLSFRQHADECRMLARRAELPDREVLLNMAGAWEAITRRLQNHIRLAKRMPY